MSIDQTIFDRDDQIEALFAAACDQPATDRSDWVRRACGENEPLAREVIALVVAFGNGRGLPFSSPTMDAEVDQPESAGAYEIGQYQRRPTSGPIGEKPGNRIGPFKLLQQIGEGGFGLVFLAEQIEPVRRKVALKVIKPGMDSREVIARFEAERQALAMMDHPNIAKVFDAGATDSGRPYFVMELVVGDPITTYCDVNRLTARQRLELMVSVCRAVHSAHQKFIIHRDIKPSNVLVTLHDGKPVPKVIDFGIAKAMQMSLTDRTLFTQFGGFVGTPAYMSPEQTEKSGLDVDVRSDVYGLGVLLYELLTGTTPVGQDQLRAVARDEMLRLIRDSEPVRPSLKLTTLGGTLSAVAGARGSDSKSLGQTVRGEPDWIVMKSLEKDRTRRYDSAAALADDLVRYLNGDPVTAGPPGNRYKMRKFVHRHGRVIGIAAVVVSLLLLGIAGTTAGLVLQSRQRRVAEQQRTAAESARADADRQRSLAEDRRADAEARRKDTEAVLEFLQKNVLAMVSPEVTPDRIIREGMFKALIEPAIVAVNQNFRDRPLVRASIQQTLATTLNAMGKPDLALALARSAAQIRKTELGPADPDTLASQDEVAVDLLSFGRLDESESISRKNWETARKTFGPDDSRTVDCMTHLALALEGLGRLPEAEQLHKRAWEMTRSKLGENDPRTPVMEAYYAGQLAQNGRAIEAVPLLKEAWHLTQKIYGDDHRRTMFVMGSYIEALEELDNYERALPLAKEAYDRAVRILGEQHQITLFALGNYSVAVYGMRHPAEAVPLFKQEWDLSRRLLGDNSPETNKAQKNYEAAVRETQKQAARTATTAPADPATDGAGN